VRHATTNAHEEDAMNRTSTSLGSPVAASHTPAAAGTPLTQLVEEGAAFHALSAAGRVRAAGASLLDPDANAAAEPERFEVIVIGAGQAGLSVGYHLARRGLSFVILEAHSRIGDSWRRRWDSLRLFTPARYDGLDGMPFPAAGDSFPTKDEMGDYLKAYADRFALPVRTGTKVDSLARVGDRYVVTAGERRFEAGHVVVALANFQRGRVPQFAEALDPGIVQLHSSDYRNPSQLRPGGVLIVGAGNSGSEIAKELAREGRDVWMSGRDTGHLPFRIESFLGRHVLVRMVLRVLFHRILTVSSPVGRKARPEMLSKGGPLIRVKPKDLAALGVVRVPRVAGVKDGRAVLEDGRVPDAANVIWCTGFHPNFSWIRLPVFGERGAPEHERGVVPGEPGLYFVGLEFLYAFSSTMIHGVGRDARFVAERIAARSRVAA
jgi:putative flavoprotein involved in K+ transport